MKKSYEQKGKQIPMKAVIAQFSQTAQSANRDRLVIEHLALAKGIAIPMSQNLPLQIDRDDLVHGGGSVYSTRPRNSIPISKWPSPAMPGIASRARSWIACASSTGPRETCGGVISNWKPRRRSCKPRSNGRPPKLSLALELGVDIDRWRKMMVDLCTVGLISACPRIPDHDNLPAPDFPGGSDTHPDNICSHKELRSILGVVTKTLPERYQKIVYLYYTSEMTMKGIGGILGINESRVCQIHKSALEKMLVVLHAKGIHSVNAF